MCGTSLREALHTQHIMCGSRKYPYPPHGRDWNFQGGGGGGGSKAQENPEPGGGVCINLYYFFQTGAIIPIC